MTYYSVTAKVEMAGLADSNPPRNKWGMVEEQKAVYTCDNKIFADGGATL